MVFAKVNPTWFLMSWEEGGVEMETSTRIQHKEIFTLGGNEKTTLLLEIACF